MTAAIAALNRRTFASLAHRNYRLYFAGQVVSVTGTWMQNIAMAWLVLDLTHSPVAVGVLALCQFLPFTIFGLFAGVIVDRFDVRRLVIGTQAVSMVLAAALAIPTLLGHTTPELVYLLAALRGTVLVLDAPSRQALTFRMVGPKELPNAVALNSSLFNGARVVGPALGGAVVALAGAGFCFAFNAVSFLAVLAGLLLMRPNELLPAERSDTRPRLLAGTREALTYVRRTPQAGTVLILVAIVSTFAFNINVLLPVLAKVTLNSGPATFGIVTGCFGAGALIGALIVASLANFKHKGKLLTFGNLWFPVMVLLFSLSTSLPVSMLILAGAGLGFLVQNATTNTLIQNTVPDHLRGRVMAVYMFVFNGFFPLGALMAGFIAQSFTIPIGAAFGGAVALCYGVFLLWRVPLIRRLA